MNLIPMTDFVLHQHDICPDIPTQSEAIHHLLNCKKYALFLKQPLTVGIFMPCDEEGNRLKNPYLDHVFHQHSKLPVKLSNFTDEYVLKYEKSKQRVLLNIEDANIDTILYLVGYYETIENLCFALNCSKEIVAKITLTEAAIKIIETNDN